MTTYDRIMNKGIEKGELKKLTEMILALYDDGIGLPQIAKYAKITEVKIVEILKDNGRMG